MGKAIEGLGTTLTIGSASLDYITLSGMGLDGGEPIDCTTLSNSEVRTSLPQTLYSIPNLSFTATFEPTEFDLLVSEINENKALTLDYDGTGQIVFWGYLKSFTPEQGAVGERWSCSGEIVVTNMNSSGQETVPVYSS